MVKNAYDMPMQIEYPLVVVTEINNSENINFTTREGEQVTNLGYQIESMCEQTAFKNEDGSETILSAADSAKLLGTKISKLLGGNRYKMTRTGQELIQTVSADSTVKRHIQRFECCLELKTNTLYRRY